MSNPYFTLRSKNFVPLEGKVFSRLTVIEEVGKDPTGAVTWKCLCICGKTTVVSGVNLRRAKTTSCGCYALICRTAHGKYQSAEYAAWHSMWHRCTNSNNKRYSSYKDRTPPDSWRDFAVFYAELGPRPTVAHSLDRIKNWLPYGPGNCRWATDIEQNQNKRTNVFVVFGGERLCIAEACRKSGLNKNIVASKWRRTKDMLLASSGLFDIDKE